MSTIEEDLKHFRQQAAEAREMAGKAYSDDDRDRWLKIAGHWDDLTLQRLRAAGWPLAAPVEHQKPRGEA